ncbi:hypothetical protein NQ314_001762 [Rhamnusium bicolor]|uniref:PiggyBac transposable element-derived protein domain-containing protein n=1 Tax=Rhamnusium bicolor TaxID=1586634 RepID=A0AAV8ZR26_9CUCU|nr:hypothetical protein NQ314_001762 [Rhamnusium bicolor]
MKTNRYAAQEKAKSRHKKARIQNWKDTDQAEMKKILGCILWMEILSLPSIFSYWSKNFRYHNNLRYVLPRNRFQMLLKSWHFADNTAQYNADDRLFKITPVLNIL